MKKYDIEPDCYDGIEEKEKPNGDWVRANDAEKEIEKAIKLAIDFTWHASKVSGCYKCYVSRTAGIVDINSTQDITCDLCIKNAVLRELQNEAR